METVNSWFLILLQWFALMPQEGWAILFGIGLSGAITQWFKKAFPLHLIWPGQKEIVYKSSIRVIALVLAFVPTYAVWPAGSVFRFWAALAVGFGTPIFYKVFIFFLYRKWPQLEEKLSGGEM